ncbi:MAG: 4-hydroxy-3-methylbut-2-enyl diphosphate reductase [Phycisphaerae bacterium]|nr:4-hydroxy-3-methylbut-2-enyl diphosphate reductase [Phycisphaerae bacterium]
MKVIVADSCGFCPGVKNAISVAEKILGDEKNVYCLGPIIHNKDVVDHLAQMGLKTVDSIEDIESGTVLIRSHGVSPEIIKKLRQKGLKIVDATCVLVKRVQKIASEFSHQGYQVVIIGDADHPEVQAVYGCAKGAIVVADEKDLHKIPENSKLGIVCQTTKGPELFNRMVAAIAGHGFAELHVVNTLCRETVKRQQSAIDICKKVDVMFVLGGLQSANTRTLATLCKKYNDQTFHLQNFSECAKSMIFGREIVGITAGASTPDWIIEDFIKNLQSFDSGSNVDKTADKSA